MSCPGVTGGVRYTISLTVNFSRIERITIKGTLASSSAYQRVEAEGAEDSVECGATCELAFSPIASVLIPTTQT
jgi:hypothetical protein